MTAEMTGQIKKGEQQWTDYEAEEKEAVKFPQKNKGRRDKKVNEQEDMWYAKEI